jgi:hypothetical protein
MYLSVKVYNYIFLFKLSAALHQIRGHHCMYMAEKNNTQIGQSGGPFKENQFW